jgi:uncharacterized protein YjiS (DUF1127 family)
MIGLLQQLLARFARWNHRRATIHALRKLSDWQLRDIGLTRGEIPTVVGAAFEAKAQTRSTNVSPASRTRVRPQAPAANGGPAVAA